jgi:AcrR family transcriptional regulator
MSTKTTDRTSARDRLLTAADELFYEEGVHTVGIDRVIERAGVAKASLYNTYGSKDELVRAYLEKRLDARKERMRRGLERFDSPRERLLGVFDVLRDTVTQTNYRGCAFQNASAESSPGSSVREVCDASRDWMRTMLTGLAADAGAADPVALGGQLVLLYDGVAVSVRMDHDVECINGARAAAELLLDAQLRSAADRR